MNKIDDLLSKCKVKILSTVDISDSDLWVFTLDNPTPEEVSMLRNYLQHLFADADYKLPAVVWRETILGVKRMSIAEAVALRDILNRHIEGGYKEK